MNPTKTIRIVFFSDTHLGFDYPIRPKVERRRRGQEFFDNYQRVLSYAVESKADLLLHGGDLFFRSRLPRKIVDLAYGPLIECADHELPIFLVPGNHERSNMPISLFLNHPYIHVFDRPKTIYVTIKGAGIALSGFPFERERIRDRFQDVLEATDWRNAPADIKLLCMHQIVQGARVGTSNYTFGRGMDVIQKAHLPDGFHAILAGHIHRSQVLRKQQGRNGTGLPIIYPGSTERTSFAEKGEKKGYFEIEFVPYNDGDWKIGEIRFLELPTRSMEDIYIDRDLRVEQVRSYLHNKTSNFKEDAIVRLQCGPNVDQGVQKMLTASFLREVIPSTMNIQFSQYRMRTASDGVNDAE